jgi:hypothetical protein
MAYRSRKLEEKNLEGSLEEEEVVQSGAEEFE